MLFVARLQSLWALLLLVGTFTTALAGEGSSDRFTPQPGFRVEEVLKPGAAGSLVAMAFNEAGDIIASREQGPLLLIQDKDGDGHFEAISTYCDLVKNCQGILPLDGHVYAVGDGPDGTAFYRLTDTDADGQADKAEALVKYKGGMGEHGPHAPVLGPDGLIYLMLGNHCFIQGELAPTSPHHHFYDAELITPKYEDANGHASGLKAPGGTVVRTDRNGSFLELFVGGFRNAYDHAFNRAGELFTYDSDMEWDVGLPWYRPTRVNHLVPGAEFGWRSGWSKWPAYYVDSLPAVVDTGRGSPTGVVFYEHTKFPAKYHDALFMCDWSMGRIVAVTLKAEAGTYTGTAENFLEGRPLNCSDIDVGPDGWLYISVGGRNTEGSIFRVVAENPPEQPTAATGIAKAIRQPQPSSAWARHAVSQVRQELGDQWGPNLFAVAVNRDAAPADRVRALELMELSNVPSSDELLIGISKDPSPAVRAKAAYQMGLHPTGPSNDRLVAMLDDEDPNVRRVACASLVRARHEAPVEKLLERVAEPNRFVAWQARRALELVPQDRWQSLVLSSTNPRVFIQGAVALETLGADRATCDAILTNARRLLDTQLSNDDLLDIVRVIQLALHRGEYQPDDQPALRDTISKFFPSDDARLNRELVRTLVMLQDPTLAPRLVAHLKSNAPVDERIQAAMLGRFLNVGWTPELRSGLLEFFAFARGLEGGNSYRGYLTNGANDVLKNMPPEEQLARIQNGASDPAGALGVVQHLSDKLSPEVTAALLDLDRKLAGNNAPAAKELAKAAIVALGYGGEAALAYLHEVFESSPDRRQDVALALATYSIKTKRRDEDWPVLVRSLPVVEGSSAREVLRALQRYQKRNDKPQEQRQVILLGLKLGDNGGREASQLLMRWTGAQVAQPREPWQSALAAWQKWFAETYPDLPEAALPQEPEGQALFASVIELLNSPAGAEGDAARGAQVFEKAQCIKCHRYGNRGEGIGPDLTNVSKRFQKKEILESVIFPSLVISDQFAAKSVLTVDGQVFTGLVGDTADGVVVLQTNGEKVNVAKDDIEQIVPSKKSAMPEGLFNNLNAQEIADLFAYLAVPPQN
jgi:putative membrane-bound dehydrogenase-like protein